MDRGIFGRWLDAQMDNQDVSGKQLALDLGVTDGAISRWRNGQSVPSQDNLPGLAEALDVDPLRLMATVGVPGIGESGVVPLPVPRNERRRERAREELSKIKYLTNQERKDLLATYDTIVRERP